MTTPLPRLKDAGSFGDVVPDAENVGPASADDAAKEKAEQERALEVLGQKASPERQAREDAVNARGNLFDPEVDDQAAPVDRSKLIQSDTTNRKEETKLRRLEGRPQKDSLAAIEERLNIKRNK